MRKTRAEEGKKVENEDVNEHEHPISKKKEKKRERDRENTKKKRSTKETRPSRATLRRSTTPLRFYGSESVRVDVLLIAGAECANFWIQECRRRNLTDFRLRLVINAAFPQRTSAHGEREAVDGGWKVRESWKQRRKNRRGCWKNVGGRENENCKERDSLIQTEREREKEKPRVTGETK